MSSEELSPAFAKWMTVFAWLCFMILAGWGFSALLDKQYNPNQDVSSSRQGDSVLVSLQQNRQGHYVATGYINGHEVVFLLDTGATSVSVPAHLANKLGLRPFGRGIARTANGDVEIAYTSIGSLMLGELELNNVEASINPGMRDDHILLGMSALKRLEFTQRGDTLILRNL